MSREQVQKLLGGYATGTLTPEEQQALFAAALEDQDLFDALAREQSLRDLLRDPAAKAQLLAALGDAPATWRERASRWMWGHAVGLAAVACFVTVGGYFVHQARFTPPRVVVVATEPTRVEVNGSQPPAQPRRTFDLDSARKAAAPLPEAPPPPEVKQPAIAHVAPRQFLAERFPAFAGQPPGIPLPAPPPAPQAGAEARPPQNQAAASAMGGGGGGGRGGGGPIAPAIEQAAVTAMATPVQTASAEQSQKLDETNQVANLALKGRDMFGILQQMPGARAGNAYLPGGDTAGAQTQLQTVQLAAMASGPLGGGKLDPALLALVQRVRSGAPPAAAEKRFVTGGEASVRVTLTNASPDSLKLLRNAGFDVTRQDRTELAGRIAVEKLEAVTQFAFVVWIAAQ